MNSFRKTVFRFMTHIQQQNADKFTRVRYITPVSDQMFSLLAGLSDIIIIMGVSVLSGIVYHLFTYGDMGIIANFLKVGALVTLFFILPHILRGRYTINGFLFQDHPWLNLFYTWNFAFFCVLAIGFITKLTDIYSRGSVLITYIAGFAVLFVVRRILARLILEGWHSGLVASRQVMLVGTDQNMEEFQTRYKLANLGLQTRALVSLTPEPAMSANGLEGLDTDLEFAANRARTLNIDDVYILVPWSQKDVIERCLETFMTLPVSIHLGPERILDRFRDINIEKLGSMSSLKLTRPPLKPMEIMLKRSMDIVFSLAGLILLSPLFVLVGLLIRLDSNGPVFYRQKRHGFNHEVFNIYKFRTMKVSEEGENIRQATRDDPRITRLGRILRRYNIDELPQLLNVLKGEMSIVGPRPHAMIHNREWKHKVRLYARRHNMKPGITGWAQINGWRGETDTDIKIRSRVEHDLYYIDNWSIWLDLYIILATVFSRKSYHNAC